MDFDAQRLARPAIVAMQAYQSARSQTAATAAGRIFLDANEFSEASEPSAQAAPWSRYPDPQPAALQALLTARFAVAAPSLFLGAGVDDAIDALVRVFCEARQDSIVVTPPTYGYYSVAAAIQGAEVLAAPLRLPTFDLDEAAILARCRPHTKLVFICSPNNPTGNTFAPERLLALAAALRSQALLVIDEAYIEFSACRSLAAAAAAGGNLVVLRTLSKAWGLAGARLGAAIAAPSVIQLMQKVRAPYPISRPAVSAVVAELQRLTPAVLAARISAVNTARASLASALARLPSVRQIYPSDANFLLVRTTDAGQFVRCCSAAGIVVRDRSAEPGLADCVRISVGAPAEHAALLAALEALK